MAEYKPLEFTHEELLKIDEFLKAAYDLTRFHVENNIHKYISSAQNEVFALIGGYKSYSDYLESEEFHQHVLDQEAHSEVTLEAEYMEEGYFIPIKEYARMHRVDPSVIRHACINGKFLTAKKIGRDWFISSTEPYIDRRKKRM